ncbi:MAG: hypothetical protein IKP67_00185 [Spirochaetales bacterium]|nr:hypothetical protein [Spirochaetales bacterium]
MNDNAVLFTAADIAEDKIQWGDLKDEIQRYKQDMTNHPYDYTPMDWSKAFPDNTTDWSKVKDVTIDLADADTVDVIGATVLKRYIDAKLEEAGKTKEDIENIVHFTDYATDAKLNLDFNKLGEKGLSNTDLMGVIFGNKFDFDEQKGNSEVFTDLGYDIAYGKAGLADRTDDLIPGVQLVTFPNEYNYPGYRLNSFSQAFKFTSPAVVTMPQDTTYDLTGAYKGGILGKVTIDGLENATMSGEIYKHDIKGIYNTFVKDKTDLPRLSLKIMPRVADKYDDKNKFSGDEVNIYGTKIDEIIETYYKNNNSEKLIKLEKGVGSGLSFDGSEYVLANGGSMYENQGNGYIENGAYNLGVNAALVMAQSGMNISDVNVVDQSYDAVDSRAPIFGAGDDAGTQRYVNVRFSADISGFTFSSNTRSAGIIDIAGPAPQNLPEGNGLPVVIVRKEAVYTKDGSQTHTANLATNAYEFDLSDLSADEVSRAQPGAARWTRCSEDGYSSVSALNKFIDGDATSDQIPSIKAIEQGVRNGVDPQALEYDIANNHASVSPKKMKEKKDANLMRAILNGKDKEYS